jgi:hypothetical protein
VSEEIQPYIVYRLEDGRVECAVWQLQDGPQALALFLSGDSAAGYCEAAHLESGWRIFRPEKPALFALLKACHQAGIRFAVLDPDHEKARHVFDIQEIIAAVESGQRNDPR